MVHEINPSAEQDEGIVNSTSLEDVALSEMSDRAQSIQSLHSVLETPTPDNTPSFDELQQRLEASNRNMQHLQDEQAKLLHIQNLAKSHLTEMEQLRQHADRLPHNSNGGEAPKYESVQQVQDDMASLVGRMKNLTAFIHNQNELSTVLGDDGPEIMAEQEALQQKLESLRTQREDMRNLVDELNSINRTARESTRAIKEETPTPPPKPAPVPVAVKERVVPVEYQRNVPIMRQEAANAAQRALHAQAMINQKTADIEALKAQMARLKGMLNTVSQIEESTPSMGASLERRSEERTSVERELPTEIAQRVFALNDVTSELRAEAVSLQKERDRILALKAEIERRKQQAAAAVQMGEDALKRNSLTPTPTPIRQHQVAEEEEDPSEVDTTSLQATPTKEQLRDELRLQCERLRKEYEQKQRELEQRYVASNNTTSEADDEGNDDTDSDKYFANVRTASSATLKRAASASTVVEQRRGQQASLPSQPAPPPPAPPSTLNEDDLNVTLDTLSLGNDSLPSSSNRSQYMPPPMAPVPGIWASHNSGNSWHGQQPIYGQTNSGTGNEFKAPPAAPQVGSSNASGSNASTDAVLLQQFMQTQQMLINSVCQCNQTLWHQQREIDNLNNQLHTLQDRLNVVACQDHSFGLRSESVPPPNLPVGPGMGQMPNNLCLGNSRAQSEQLFNFGAHQSAFSNYQRSCHRTGSESHHHHHQQQQQQQQQAHQQQPFLNNAAPPPPPPTHYNNETPLSPPTYRSSPGPIFMNHHNNTIHQNNSNLRTQNQHANNLHSLPEGAAGGGAPGGGITLNNQVPPGNRANNYWDNFRSHSRQNLLSNKSNEELNVDLQQYRRQRARPSYFQPPQLLAPPTTRGGLTHQQQQQQQPQQQQQQQQRRHFFESPLTALHGSSNGSNNLNNSGSAARKRDWRDDGAHNRDQDDEDLDEVEENHDNVIFGSGRRRNRRRPQLSTLRDEEPEQASSSNLNMNVNYGNSPLYQRNKVPAKPTTSTVSLTPLQQRHLRFDFELPAHYMDYIELPQLTPVDNTPLAGQDACPADESNAMEQSEETASEELNRNLLVNALKNDKFTTKFYESIKEDVYRRLETLFEQQQLQQQQQQQQLQQQQNQQLQQSLEPHGLRKALNQEENEPSSVDAEATESRSETPLEVMRLQLDNDRPEDEKGSPVKNQLTVVIPQNGHAQEELEASASVMPSTVKLENEEQMLEGEEEEEHVAGSGAGAGAGASVELAPDHELIEYIIKRIRNQTHNNTVINDSLLAEVSKLTATAAQNSAASSPLISPKRIYAKIKKMEMPRQRDEFLLWYRSYLEQLFVVEQSPPPDNCKAKLKSPPPPPPPSAGSPAKQTRKRVREQSQSQSQDSNNDADLAEADQKNVSSAGNGDLECENNENPGEEADGRAAAESSGGEKQDTGLE
ncbi:uncharacterized protein LOC128257667 isoform X3 [Drosophila gunungcola]|nr:uncharacterized protein LOC128257667 isoform X3 [Drosophila gunungcola]XP_052844733.1 uncharacterized protein LOC128257667 isoform X3 [Drosophila gunungcola]